MMDADNSSRCFISSRSWGWTNERHLRFLNSIEASFVRAMSENINYYYYDNNNNNNNDDDDGLSSTSDLRFDRHVPDSSESTQDLRKLRRRRTFSTSPDAEDEEERSVRASKKNKGRLSNDQVVPQLETGSDNENDKDGKNVDVST